MTIRLGCIADDITGGTDLALSLSKNGLKVMQVFDIAAQDAPAADAVVVSLKIRTAPKDIAVVAALKAYGGLKDWGADQIYFKYCSTFDSTQDGNIGPIAEAINLRIGANSVPFVPSFPENGRTVRQGNLYVDGQLLSESSMKDHPLTPMKEPNLCVHLAQQLTAYQAGLVSLDIIEKGPACVFSQMQKLANCGQSFLIMDCTREVHLAVIAKACESIPFLTGGSAFAGALAAVFKSKRSASKYKIKFPYRNGPIAIFSGSCSAASIEQVKRASDTFPVIPLTLSTHPAEIISMANKKLDGGVIFVSSTAPPEAVSKNQSSDSGLDIGEDFEQKFADIAISLYKSGVNTFIVGGGETSGAVAKSLGLKCLEVGPEITPGVPWMMDQSGSGINITFKSGNFGGPDFFTQAVNSLKPPQDAK